jgi:hypothetical protein
VPIARWNATLNEGGEASGSIVMRGISENAVPVSKELAGMSELSP